LKLGDIRFTIVQLRVLVLPAFAVEQLAYRFDVGPLVFNRFQVLKSLEHVHDPQPSHNYFICQIEAKMSNLSEVQILIYEPNEVQTNTAPANIPSMTPGRAAMVLLIKKYLSGLMDPFVTLLEVHKLMYFMQESGEPLKLNYKKGYYGPYAKNLSHILKAVERHFITGYGDGGDDPTKPLKLVPGAVDDAEKFLSKQVSTRQNLERVRTLVTGFETPDSLELLATVHWLMKHSGVTDSQLTQKVYAWDSRKKRFSEHQIMVVMSTIICRMICSILLPYKHCRSIYWQDTLPLLLCDTPTGYLRLPRSAIAWF